MSQSKGTVSDPLSRPVFWSSTEGPFHYRYGHEDYWVWKTWERASDHPDVRKVWAGFKVKGSLGETLHRVAEDTDGQRLLAMHLEDASIQARGRELLNQLASLQFESRAVEVSRSDSPLLSVHGVTDGSRVEAILYPAGMTVLESLINQDAFLITNSHKIIDIAAHAWPIDIDQARDCRSRLLTPVRYGDHVGVVAGCFGEFVILKAGSQMTVPMQDLEPVMVKTSLRKTIGGV